MSVVKLEKEKQVKLKRASKAVYIIAKIVRILSIIAIVFLAIGTTVGVVFASHVDVKDGIVEITIKDVNIKLKEEENGVSLVANGENIDIDDQEAMKSLGKVTNIFKNNSKQKIIGFFLTIMIINIAGIVVLAIILKNVENLFKNIHDEDTPFTLENVEHIKKIFYFMLATIILPIIGDLISNLFIENELELNIKFSIMTILVIYCAMHIFEYGYEIQQDSEGRIYGDENE